MSLPRANPSTAAPRRLEAAAFACAVLVALAGCASPRNHAPVEERPVPARSPIATTSGVPVAPVPAGAASAPVAVAPSAPAAPAEAAKPGLENLGKPGYYQVKPGDTLIRIALDNGQNWRDLAKWNGIENPNVLEAGQVLRVWAPAGDGTGATRPIGNAKVESRPLDAKPAPAPTSAGAASTPPAPPPPPPPPPGPPEPDDDIAWQWPAAGPVASGFEEGRTKGVVLLGKLGDPVFAAADGRVVYAGSGLRGYGNLLIIKHNNTYLTAYAHNRILLVKEDQNVRRGQKIAEMGSTDADRVQLHFEIRRLGKPVDPVKLLPPR
jgi:lipoprotein NlpD